MLESPTCHQLAPPQVRVEKNPCNYPLVCRVRPSITTHHPWHTHSYLLRFEPDKTRKMASQKSQNNPGMKQKSLMGWLSQKQGGQANANANQEKATEERTKGSSTATSSSVKKDEGKGKGGASKMGSTSRAIENSSKGSNAKSVQNDASSKPTSSPPDANLVGSSSFLSGKSSSDHGHDTPPTSEGIDVDMLSDDDAPPAKPVSYAVTYNVSMH